MLLVEQMQQVEKRLATLEGKGWMAIATLTIYLIGESSENR
jgi:hypothetical protein